VKETTLTGNWGITEIPDGIRLNMQVQQDEIFYLPFAGEPLKLLIEHASKGLTPEQKRELAPLFTSGIVLPGNGDLPPVPRS
jgi:hypothetical protein